MLRKAPAILLQTVPETIITSDWRDCAGGKTEPLGAVTGASPSASSRPRSRCAEHHQCSEPVRAQVMRSSAAANIYAPAVETVVQPAIGNHSLRLLAGSAFFDGCEDRHDNPVCLRQPSTQEK